MNPFVKNKKQIGLFVTAGFPKKDATLEHLTSIQASGYDFIEVGMPFSDPLADGPVIQMSSEVALKDGMNMDVLFGQLQQAKETITIPLILMGYLNPVLQFGLDEFLKRSKEVGVSHLILPDMSIELYERFYQKQFEAHQMGCCFLITTHTRSEIVERIANVSKNSFVYLVSSNSTTGMKQDFQMKADDHIQRIKSILGPIPLFIGFGISKAEDIQRVHEIADGAIVGSALIKAIEKGERDRFLKDLMPSSVQA